MICSIISVYLNVSRSYLNMITLNILKNETIKQDCLFLQFSKQKFEPRRHLSEILDSLQTTFLRHHIVSCGEGKMLCYILIVLFCLITSWNFKINYTLDTLFIFLLTYAVANPNIHISVTLI